MPSELRECGLRRSHWSRTEGHPLGATIARLPRDQRLTLTGNGSANPAAKIRALVTGMIAGAGRSQTWTCCATVAWAGCSTRPDTLDAGDVPAPVPVRPRPPALRGRGPVVDPSRPRGPDLDRRRQGRFVDLDDTVRQVCGCAKQDAGRGYTGLNGLNAAGDPLHSPRRAPVFAATRLRKGRDALGARRRQAARRHPVDPDSGLGFDAGDRRGHGRDEAGGDLRSGPGFGCEICP
jgi:hypothetical protein